MQRSGVFLQVVVDKNPVREYQHHDQVFVVGDTGKNYALRIINSTSKRILAVASVDGKSVMDGKPATRNGGGYVINAHDSVDIPGWMLDPKAVAAFQFSSPGGSYAAASGETIENLGVIGAAIWAETAPVPLPKDFYGRSSMLRSSEPMLASQRLESIRPPAIRGQSAGGGQSAGAGVDEPLGFDEPLKQNVGTAFGEKTEFKTVQASFSRSHLMVVMVLRYNDREGLRRLGIDLDAPEMSDPFPADSKAKYACKPPAGWQE